MQSAAIVITGAEVVTSLGLSRQQTWDAVVQGRCGMGPLTALESPIPADKVGGQAVDLPADFMPDAPREVRYLKWTIEAALREAGALNALPYGPERCGFVLGTTLHGMRAGGQFLRSGEFAPLGEFLAGSTLELAVAGLPASGFSATTCSACSSSLGSVALAVTLLRSGQFDLIVCGGYDTVSEYAYGGFNSLRLVAEGPLRPFARDRQGMKLGEGYGILVLERAADAAQRGATALAQVLGYGESADAHHLTQPHPEGEGASRAMAAALRSAGVQPGDIGLIAAHATGTPDNDAAEHAALARVFGEQLPRTPAVGFKSHLGHTLGGAGAVELILAMTAMREQTAPPCANVTPEEVEFADLNLITGAARPAVIRATLSTSLGFGGANTCVVLGAAPQSTPAVHAGGSDGPRDVLITGIGVIVPGAAGNEAFVARLASGAPDAWHADAGPIPEEQFAHLLNARRVRRMSDHVKLTLAATAIACQDAAIADVPAFAAECGAILGSTHGAANYSLAYYGEIIKQGIVGANPMLFAEGVPNACSAHLSLMLGVKGACQTIIGTRTAGLDAVRLAALRIAGGAWDRAIVGAAEEYNDVINQAYRHCGLYAGRDGTGPFGGDRGFVTGSAAVTLVLESRASLDRRGGGRVHGRVLDAASSRGTKGHRTAAHEAVLKACMGGADALAALAAQRSLAAGYVMSSANGTWADRAEAAAIRRACPGATVSSIYGHVAEAFSVGPLLGLVGTLLSGKMPRLRGDGLAAGDGLTRATGAESPDSVLSLCTDYGGGMTALRTALGAGGR